MAEGVVQLRCGNDGWGKQGKESIAAQLWSKTPNNGPIGDSEHYSEMWMGTYPSNPSYLLSTGEHLGEYLKKHPELVGKSIHDRWGPEIPFLPKASEKAKNYTLPLQIHPDLKLAAQLNKEHPEKYGDTMHKPEIAIALSKFELFAGWKPLKDIEALFKLNHLAKYIPKSGEFNDETLRQVCKALLSAPAKEVEQTSKDLQAIPESQFGAYTYIPGLLARLAEQYGEGDNGNLVAALLMNYMTLGPGDSVFVPADSIHAYLEGDIVECMARSDNVINTGFCPAADRDSVELFGQALTFAPHNSQDALLPRKKSDKGLHGKTDVYAPPISEFSVLCTTLGAGESETHKAILGPSLIIVTKGCGQMKFPGNQTAELKEGYVFFVGQGIALDFMTDKGMALYRAYAE
ncbi:unnamed protein product [Penicillium nalgiovense]|uniref:Mannose-6-phosphate isomerase n=1 Tax=Penicillium nalgiovense TaxID=60175 RepID=A0A9W4N7X7_PENNA|nr:unnamed protein product [Penicillium nalgiovense]CAG7975047.1 unnamed protein product [Penicillium nalgiovense]CAG8078809.1 unnamed protein product [Penicillium nalgiovense]CAG8115924.1 unnamed protein product [Penicillium nalgiovense]CAG8127293.1 unnamed protein product [Penicillium nalgiovense]